MEKTIIIDKPDFLNQLEISLKVLPAVQCRLGYCTCHWTESVFVRSNQHVRLTDDFISQESCVAMPGDDTRHERFTCKCDDEKQIKNWRGLCCDLRRRFMQHFAENGCSLLFQLVEICRGSKPMKALGVLNLIPHIWKKWGLTSVCILTPKVVSVEEHELDPVALVQCHQADQQQEDGTQTSGQLHRVHQLC